MKKNNKKIIIIIIIIIVILIIILGVLNRIAKTKSEQKKLLNNVKQYTSVEDFKTIEEVALFLECEYKKQENSKEKEFNIDIYMKIKYAPYTENKSNEAFYNKLILYCAEVLKYKNFRIIDSKNNIEIDVKCDEKSQKIKNIIINGEDDYFLKRDSIIQLDNLNEESEIELNIQSEILKKIINQSWMFSNNLASKESSYNQYDIYFDEGIEVKNINNKIYNLIFTSKYKDNIVNNIKTSTSQEDIIKTLGKPNYVDEQYGVIGYKGTQFYIFFNNKNEVSIYRLEKEFDTESLDKMINEYLENKDINKLVQDIKEKYKDFDRYSNNSDGLDLRYSLRGIEIDFNKKSDSGIKIYKNFTGTLYNGSKLENLKDKISDNIIIKNENSVWNSEIERLSNNYLTEYNASTEKLNDPNKNNSNKFYAIKESLSNNLYKISFLSVDGENVNSELKENVNDYIWIDDYNFLYSIKNSGIYVYNVISKKYATLVSGKEEFSLKEYSENILKYDDKSIKIGK